MRARTLTLMIAATSLAPAALAHDFWIEPAQYHIEPGEEVSVDILTGHGEDTASWPIAPHRIIGLRSLGPDGLTSHATGRASLSGDTTLSFAMPGQHMVFIETTNSISRLEAKKFNDYAEEEGILPIISHRTTRGQMKDEGSELYSRRGKALIEVGCTGSDEAMWSKPLGLTLEVIPGTNPFEWDEGMPFPVAVYYHGAPVPGATLHVTQLDAPDTSFSATTNADGMADLSGLTEGRWLAHTVWSEPVDGLLEDAEFQTVFSSFTFETSSACTDE